MLDVTALFRSSFVRRLFAIHGDEHRERIPGAPRAVQLHPRTRPASTRRPARRQRIPSSDRRGDRGHSSSCARRSRTSTRPPERGCGAPPRAPARISGVMRCLREQGEIDRTVADRQTFELAAFPDRCARDGASPAIARASTRRRTGRRQPGLLNGWFQSSGSLRRSRGQRREAAQQVTQRARPRGPAPARHEADVRWCRDRHARRSSPSAARQASSSRASSYGSNRRMRR